MDVMQLGLDFPRQKPTVSRKVIIKLMTVNVTSTVR